MVNITEQDYIRVAKFLGIDVPAIKAVAKVETGGRGGFFAPGKPAILFEGQVFWKELQKVGLNPAHFQINHPNIVYPKMDRKQYKGKMKEYVRLEEAMTIHKPSALKSASYGMFQIMGFNHSACGYGNVEDFVKAMSESEGKQLECFASFIKSQNMARFLQAKDWAGFAKRYNGPAYEIHSYDKELEKAYKLYSNG